MLCLQVDLNDYVDLTIAGRTIRVTMIRDGRHPRLGFDAPADVVIVRGSAINKTPRERGDD